jgi:4,5-DOPA dioxygenase extradiol
MQRKVFLKVLALISAMKLKDLSVFANMLPPTPKMPVLFLGHGSPMNAIEDNEFVKGFRQQAQSIPTPAAILCISAHWETKGTMVTAMQHPKTIHDFGGFPKALFDVQYPAPGSPAVAALVKDTIQTTAVGLDDNWGLDHGAWSVIKHLYPLANVPVLQMSIDYTQPASYHYELAKQLMPLREKGILIIGSGNMVHNLGVVAWDKLNVPNYAFDWALEASTKMKSFIAERNHGALINYSKNGKAFDLSIPTPEHYLPLIYCLALQDKKETTKLFNDKAMGGSLSMTSVRIG